MLLTASHLAGGSLGGTGVASDCFEYGTFANKSTKKNAARHAKEAEKRAARWKAAEDAPATVLPAPTTAPHRVLEARVSAEKEAHHCLQRLRPGAHRRTICLSEAIGDVSSTKRSEFVVHANVQPVAHATADIFLALHTAGVAAPRTSLLRTSAGATSYIVELASVRCCTARASNQRLHA